MTPAHIDDFYYIVSEALCELHAAFPVRHLLLVEDLSGPIKWDMTGVPDRRSRACFEALIWLADCGLVDFRSLEARDTGVEGAVLTQRAFVLLTGEMRWEGGDAVTRIQALHDARDGGQPDPRARIFGSGVQALEYQEQPIGMLLVETDAIVADKEYELVVVSLHAQLDVRLCSLG